MKFIFCMIIFTLSLPICAGGKGDKETPTSNQTVKLDTVNHNVNHASSNSASLATAGSNAEADAHITDNSVDDRDITNTNQNRVSVGMADAVKNTNDLANRFNSEINVIQQDRLQHNGPILGQDCIGSTCVSTGTWNMSGGYDKQQGPSVLIGFTGVAPWDRAKGRKKAFKHEVEKLRQENLHDKESHQADMMIICLTLHEMGVIHENESPELWKRCAGFEHHVPGEGDHNGYGNPRQVSPHKH